MTATTRISANSERHRALAHHGSRPPPDRRFAPLSNGSSRKEGSGDAFLHATVLERNGIAAVQPGETLDVRVAPGQKGPQVTEVLSVDSSTAAPAAPRRSAYPAANRPSLETAVEEVGTVKWFNAQKGFGFIVREGGGKDAFVHASVLERSGIGTLSEGQRVLIDIAEGRKGPEAVRVRLA